MDGKKAENRPPILKDWKDRKRAPSPFLDPGVFFEDGEFEHDEVGDAGGVDDFFEDVEV